VNDCVWLVVIVSRIVGTVFLTKKNNCEIYIQIILGKLSPELTEEEITFG
jgi:hypothetical protein